MKFRNVIVINGRVVTGYPNGKSQKFDEKRVEDGNSIEKVIISSAFADVDIKGNNLPNIDVHFYGDTVIDGSISFESKVVGRELRISVNSTGYYYESDLKIDISLPSKTFQIISATSSSGDIEVKDKICSKNLEIETLSGDITIGDKIYCEELKLNTSSGDVKTKAMFKNTVIKTMSGDVALYTDAQSDIDVKIKTMSGDVLAVLMNVCTINLSTNTMSDEVINRHRIIRGYKANVNASTMSGDIRIR